jgi:Trypsin
MEDLSSRLSDRVIRDRSASASISGFFRGIKINARRIVSFGSDDEDGLSIEGDINYSLNADEITPKYWGGIPVSAGAFPAIAEITRSSTRQMLCTVTLIQPDVGLAAAHCVRT